MRFLGNYEARCDAKGRVFLPAVFRKILLGSGEEKLVLRRDVFQSCLVLYPESVWNEQMDSLRARLSRWNSQQQQVYRQFVSEAEMVQLDGNGRFLISRRSMKAVEMEADVRFVGMGDTIEIWAVKKADEALMDEKTFGEELQKLMLNEE
ncbi:MAG: division/cell wall cluster transcriptional repressor MraZ [Prevotella sp.]